MLRFLNMLVIGGLAIWAAYALINASESGAGAPTPLSMAEREQIATEACLAAWEAVPGYGPVTPVSAGVREEADEVYACTGEMAQAGEVMLVARYAGGPREEAVSYRIDALCDATGKSLLEGGGRMPEACAA